MIPANFHLEPLLATGYTLLLVVIAGGLEWMGRHSHRRADQYQTGGFRFRKDAKHWECPMGARLHMAISTMSFEWSDTAHRLGPVTGVR